MDDPARIEMMTGEAENGRLARLRGLLVEFPALVKLLYRLLTDSRVSSVDKAILAGVVLYVINPLDLIPDGLPVLGQIDDAYLLALALLRLLSRSDQAVLRQHWEGRQDVVALLQEILSLSSLILPGRARRVLLGKIEKRG